MERAVLVLILVALPAIWIAPLRAVVLAGLGALVALALVDWLRTPSPRGLEVDRELPERVGLSLDFERVTRIDGGEALAGLELILFEHAPPEFEVRWRSVNGQGVEPLAGDPTGGPDRGRLPARGKLELCRGLRAHRRGVWSVGDVRLRLVGPLGLIARQARLAGSGEVRVEPPLSGLGHALKLAASERWRDLGVRHVRRRGGLTEFESLRDYVVGDDVRRIDWKAFARRGRPAVRLYEEERGQELLVLIDAGRRMGATTALGQGRGWTKLDHALDAGLQLAAVALGKGDRVGIAVFDAGLRAYVGPGRGAGQLARLTRAVFDLQASTRESDLEGALREVAIRQRRRATLVLLSDVADPLSVPAQGRALAAGARHHRVIFAGLDDPSVRRVAEGPDAGEALAVRAAAMELVSERAEGLAELARSGARVLDALPAEAAGPVLAAWLQAREG